jgi:hypothetical protein
VVIAIDDTLFRRRGRKVHAADWAYDGSLDIPEAARNSPEATPSSSPRS